MRSGVLSVDKTAGMTSFDVVALVRRRLGARRVGHAGTLDPDAEGVLPILIGEATKLMPYLGEQDKEYLATIRLGVVTDTQDLSGRVLATAEVPPLAVADLERAARAFTGTIKQVPPMFSAVHHQGRRLYELAREGREVARAPREVVVHSIEVEGLALPMATLRIVCGKGTYVRTLAADLGHALGCGATLAHLVRTRVGPFSRAEALGVAAIAEGSPESVWAHLRPPQSALAGWAEVHLEARAAMAFAHGQIVGVRPGAGSGALVAVHEADAGFIGVGEMLTEGRLKPVRILHADRQGPRVLPA
jgi:tRNA pseudouridine55 synthase